MSNFGNLRNYIDNIYSQIETDTKQRGTNITVSPVFLYEKPEQVTSTNYCVIKPVLTSANAVKRYTIEIRILTKEIISNRKNSNILTQKLNFFNRPCKIEGMNYLRISNEGGIYYDDKLDLYSNSLYFDSVFINTDSD